MKIEEQIKDYDNKMMQGHLSEKGLRHYIALLKGEILDWKEKIQGTVSKEVMTKSDLKDIEENKAKYGTTQKEDNVRD